MRMSRLCGLVGLVIVLGGCFTADVTLNADGSGTLQVKYDPMWPTTEQRERAAFQGPGLTVQEVKLGEPRAGRQWRKVPAWVEVKLAFASVADLAKAEQLWRFQIESADAGVGQKRLTVAVKTEAPPEGEISVKGDATLRVHLPGDVVESSAKVEGRTVVWTFPTKDYFTKPGLQMTATYKVPATAAAPGAGAAPTPDTGSKPAATGTPGAAVAPAANAPTGH